MKAILITLLVLLSSHLFAQNNRQSCGGSIAKQSKLGICSRSSLSKMTLDYNPNVYWKESIGLQLEEMSKNRKGKMK
ncbi:hypothetical protein J2X69_000002 [Algoriphagus sp. 4150]|uniref:hypothetical protein n=1 Tax=Algoriphagus sp. 4150 TaxID=2817756 RepID=UPI002864E671|nr:hypothetical protein [Algoriphagus sp. 4150]MDR7127674.1 hypothetical protein [Algoriphagus sp. 4150]